MTEPQSTPPTPPLPPQSGDGSLTHIRRGPNGSGSQMVDVRGKSVTARHALARAVVEFPAGRLEEVFQAGGPKGPIQEVARVAGILAAKRTPELIPMCHSLGLDHVEIKFERQGDDKLAILCLARCQGRTGVEMEAMTGVTLAALTVYDMVKGLDKGVRLGCVELLEKGGGKSGLWVRPGWQVAPR